MTYNRPEKLNKLIKELDGYDYHVIDDGSDEKPDITESRLSVLEHSGKVGFWKTFNFVIKLLINSKHDDFLILPDDVYDIDFDRISFYQNKFKNKKYFINMINDGREYSWVKPNFTVDKIDGLIHTGFFDCAGLTNRKTLEDFLLSPITNRNKNLSSGVGAQITKRMNEKKVPMFTPIKSLMFHGDHESKMNPLERKKNKLISK